MKSSSFKAKVIRKQTKIYNSSVKWTQIPKSEKNEREETQKHKNLLSERERSFLAMCVHEREREREKNVIH